MKLFTLTPKSLLYNNDLADVDNIINTQVLGRTAHIFHFTATVAPNTLWGTALYYSAVTVNISSLGLTSKPEIILQIEDSTLGCWASNATPSATDVRFNILTPILANSGTINGVILIIE